MKSIINKKLFLAWWVLRITYGVLFIAVGIDKFFCYLTDWYQFIGSATQAILSICPTTLLKIFGCIQIIAGILLFTPWLLKGTYLILTLLTIIFLNLLSVSWGVVMVHDFFMIIGSIVLIQLTKTIQKSYLQNKQVGN